MLTLNTLKERFIVTFNNGRSWVEDMQVLLTLSFVKVKTAYVWFIAVMNGLANNLTYNSYSNSCGFPSWSKIHLVIQRHWIILSTWSVFIVDQCLSLWGLLSQNIKNWIEHTQQNLFLTVMKAEKSRIKSPEDVVSREDLLPKGASLCCSLTWPKGRGNFLTPFYDSTNSIRRSPS